MSEAATEALESEAAWEASEGEGESEAASEAWSEAYPGEASGAEGSSDDARLRRQRQMILARRQAQFGRPSVRPPVPAPPRTVPAGLSTSQAVRVTSQAVRAVSNDVLTLDLDTKAALNRIRRELDAAKRDTYRNAWVTEASAASALIINSFPGALANHDWARALIIGAPTLLTADGRRGKYTVERIVTDPRFFGTLGLALIWGVSHFTQESRQQGSVHTIQLTGPTNRIAVGATPTLYAVALDARGRQLTNVPITFASDTPGSVTVDQKTGQLNAVAAGTARITASSDGISGVIYITVR